MKKEYNGQSKKGGVYKITNLKNGKKYIGSCKCFQVRASQHESRLNSGKHHNKHLLASWRKYGTNNFLFEVLEVVEGDKADRTIREQYYVSQYHKNWWSCYNFQKKVIQSDTTAWSKTPQETVTKRIQTCLKKYGTTHWAKSANARKQARLNTTKQWKSRSVEEKQEIMKKIHQQNRGKPLSVGHKKKLSAKLSGKKKSEETKSKIRQTHLGKKLSDEHREKLRLSHLGIFPTETTRKKLSQSHKGKKAKIYNTKLISPSGKIYTTITNLTEFATKHSLEKSCLCYLLQGKRKSHKGWKILDR